MAEPVKRYEVEPDGNMAECVAGEWVRWADVAPRGRVPLNAETQARVNRVIGNILAEERFRYVYPAIVADAAHTAIEMYIYECGRTP